MSALATILWFIAVIFIQAALLTAGRAFAMCLMFPEGYNWKVPAFWVVLMVANTVLILCNPWSWP